MRRSPGNTRYGTVVSGRDDRVNDLISVQVEPTPWAAYRHRDARVFRGRLAPGTAVLPPHVTAHDERGITIGLASRPLVLRSVGVAHPINAHVPWVVLSDSEWRITMTEPTDVRLGHSHDFAPALVDSALAANRPTRFEGSEGNVVRAAIKSATPSWTDTSNQPVEDLAVSPRNDWTLLGGSKPGGAFDRDQFNAFALMMAWAFEQRESEHDPRFLAVSQYIKARLSDQNLTTHAIADQLRISRRTLQALFEAEGGVAAYIRRQRLSAAIQVITRTDELPDLDTVAAMSGLGSRRTLERAMQQVYGFTPRQARTHVLSGNLLRERQGNELRAS